MCGHLLTAVPCLMTCPSVLCLSVINAARVVCVGVWRWWWGWVWNLYGRWETARHKQRVCTRARKWEWLSESILERERRARTKQPPAELWCRVSYEVESKETHHPLSLGPVFSTCFMHSCITASELFHQAQGRLGMAQHWFRKKSCVTLIWLLQKKIWDYF